MATAIESYAGSDQENYFRLCILIVDYALKVVQHVLQKELESNYPNLFDLSTGLLCGVLADGTVRKRLFRLPRGVFNKQQKDQLYPANNPSTSVTVGDLDITLTVLLLRNITKLATGSNAWDNPSDSDKSTEAEIGRVKRYRNVDYAHIKETAITLDVFREKFSGLKSSLLSLSGRYSEEEYDAILQRPLDTGLLKEYQDVMNKLYNYDKEVKEWMTENHDMLREIGLMTKDIKEKVQVIYDRNQDTPERRISPGSRSRSSSQSDSDDSPAPSTSRSDQKSGRHHKQRAKRGSKLNPATITADARDQALETSQTESRNKEIAEFYIKYMSQIQRFPWDPNDTMHIDDVYVNLEWVQEKKKPAGASFDRIQGYTSIFNDIKQGKSPKRILVRGKAGIGKTTFTQKMATDWANAILGSTTCEGILSNYKYLLILNLRSILPHQTLKKAIEMQIPCSAENEEMIEDIMCALNKDRNSVLLVFDGYDEYDPKTSKEITDIIICRRHPNVSAIITTRPWKAEQLMNRRITDGVYEITGLTEDNIAEYVAKFFDDGQAYDRYLELKPKGPHNPPTAESLQAIGKGLVGYLKSRKLMSLVKIPIILLFICLAWQENQSSDTRKQSLPGSYTLLYEKLLRLIIRRKNKIEKESEVDKYLEELHDTFWHLGERALHGLLKPGGGLIFDEEDLQSIPDIDKLYSLGLLSRSKVHCNFDVKQEVTFLHKTIQELFAAKHLARTTDDENNSVLDKFLGDIDTLDRLYDMDYVLRFLCGLSRTATAKVLRRAKALRDASVTDFHSLWAKRSSHAYLLFTPHINWCNDLLLEYWYSHCPQKKVLPPELISCHTVLCIPESFQHSDHRFQQVLYDSVNGALNSCQTYSDMFKDVSAVIFEIFPVMPAYESTSAMLHKLLILLRLCDNFKNLVAVAWSSVQHTCQLCLDALSHVISKAHNLHILEIFGRYMRVLQLVANPGELKYLHLASACVDYDIPILQQMVSLKYINVHPEPAISPKVPPILGKMPEISHDLTIIDIIKTYLGPEGVKLLARNLHYVPGLEKLTLTRVFKKGFMYTSDCTENAIDKKLTIYSNITCSMIEDDEDVCKAVLVLSQCVKNTTKLKYFTMDSNQLGRYHGITSPLTALIRSLRTVSKKTRMRIGMRDNDLGRVDRLNELIKSIRSTFKYVSSWDIFCNDITYDDLQMTDFDECTVLAEPDWWFALK